MGFGTAFATGFLGSIASTQEENKKEAADFRRALFKQYNEKIVPDYLAKREKAISTARMIQYSREQFGHDGVAGLVGAGVDPKDAFDKVASGTYKFDADTPAAPSRVSGSDGVSAATKAAVAEQTPRAIPTSGGPTVLGPTNGPGAPAQSRGLMDNILLRPDTGKITEGVIGDVAAMRGTTPDKIREMTQPFDDSAIWKGVKSPRMKVGAKGMDEAIKLFGGQQAAMTDAGRAAWGPAYARALQGDNSGVLEFAQNMGKGYFNNDLSESAKIALQNANAITLQNMKNAAQTKSDNLSGDKWHTALDRKDYEDAIAAGDTARAEAIRARSAERMRPSTPTTVMGDMMRNTAPVPPTYGTPPKPGAAAGKPPVAPAAPKAPAQARAAIPAGDESDPVQAQRAYELEAGQTVRNMMSKVPMANREAWYAKLPPDQKASLKLYIEYEKTKGTQ